MFVQNNKSDAAGVHQRDWGMSQHVMEKLTVESSRLIGLIKLLNHDVHQAMLDGKLDPNLANTHKLGAAFYTNLTVQCSCLTQSWQECIHGLVLVQPPVSSLHFSCIPCRH